MPTKISNIELCSASETSLLSSCGGSSTLCTVYCTLYTGGCTQGGVHCTQDFIGGRKGVGQGGTIKFFACSGEDEGN